MTLTENVHPVNHWHEVAAPVAAILGIKVEDVNTDLLWEFGVGSCDEDASCGWWAGR